MVAAIVTIVVGALLNLVGFIGGVLPVLPGPLLSFLSLIVISIPGSFEIFSPFLLVILGVVAVASLILDNVFPVLSSKKAGASRAGVIGSVLGIVAGMIFFPPFGVIIGAFVGALAGEVIFNPQNKAPLDAAVGVFTGTLMGILLKLIISGIILVYFFIGSGRLLSG